VPLSDIRIALGSFNSIAIAIKKEKLRAVNPPGVMISDHALSSDLILT